MEGQEESCGTLTAQVSLVQHDTPDQEYKGTTAQGDMPSQMDHMSMFEIIKHNRLVKLTATSLFTTCVFSQTVTRCGMFIRILSFQASFQL